MAANSTRESSSAYGAEALTAKARRRRWLWFVFVLVWASDWVFGWTGMLGVGFGRLGEWLWILGLCLLVYRSVVGTKLPEWLLTWAWMLGVLALWVGEVLWLGDFALDAGIASSQPEFQRELGQLGPLGSLGSLPVDRVADVIVATLALTMLGWGLGVVEVLLGGVTLGVAIAVRRGRTQADGALPVLLDRERRALRVLVGLQAPVFALLVCADLALLSGGIVLLQGAPRLPANEAEFVGHIGRLFVGVGFSGFLLGVLELRQLQALRGCGRVRLLIAGLVAIVVLGALISFAVVGHPVTWVFVLVALLWCLSQVSAVRQLWAVGQRERHSRKSAVG